VQELAIDGTLAAVALDGVVLGTVPLTGFAPPNGGTGFWSQYDERAYRDWHLVRPYRRPEPVATLR
jgi:hypothetical protein